MKTFEDLIAWKKAQDLAVAIHLQFRNLKDYGFKDQIFRAAVSISNNIAEGYDRNSDREFIRFLYIATASCSEVRSMLHLASRFGYLDKSKMQIMFSDSVEVSKIIKGLIKAISNTNSD